MTPALISRVFAGPSPSFALRRSFFTQGTPVIDGLRAGTDEATCAGVYCGARSSFRPFVLWSASALLPAARTFSLNVDSDIVAAVNSPSSVAPSSNDPQTTPARCTSHESDRVIPSTNPARTSNGQAQCAPPRRAHCALRPVRGRRLFGRPLRPRRDARAASRSGAKYGLLTRSLPRTERTSFSLNPLRPFAPLRAAAFRHRSQTSLPNPTTAPSMFLSASSTRFGAASAAASSSQRCVSSSGLNGAEVFFGRLLLSRRA